MFFPFVLLAVSIVCFIQLRNGEPAAAPDKKTFPEDLTAWCPHTKFCNLGPSEPSNSKGGVKPCCDQCSCSPDCGLTRSCCTYDDDKYKIDETLGTVCKSLNNRVNASGDDTIYHMVDKCPNKDISCNSANVSTWGSFSPVYSRSTGRIYYNSECVGCHNATDIVEFIPILATPYFAGPYSKLFSNVLIGQEEEYFLKFLVPNGIDLTSEVCHTSMIRSCNDPDASSYDLFKDLCESFNATFHMRSVTYQNVYCYLCWRVANIPKERWLEYHGMCPAEDSQRTFGQFSLVVLLDKSSISNFKLSAEEETTKYVCIGENSPEVQACRPVFCPEGHFRVRGQCVLFGRTWYVQHGCIFINITLTSDTDRLMVSDLTVEMTAELVSQIKKYIQEPNLNDWNMDLFYSEDENGTIIRYLVAQLSISSHTVNAKTLLGDIQRMIQSKRNLHITGKTFGLKAAFNNFINYLWQTDPSRPNDGLGGMFVRSRMEPNDVADLYIISLTKASYMKTLQNDVRITELFYCEQVDLQRSEFRLISPFDVSSSEIYLIRQRKRLGNGRFSGTIREGELSELRVCLSDVVEDAANQMEMCYGIYVLSIIYLYVVV